MAKAPESANGERKSRRSGPRVAKDKIVFLMFKGEVAADYQIALNAEQVLDLMEADPTWKRAKIVIPAKRPKTVAPAATA